jgi:hypothetical protein
MIKVADLRALEKQVAQGEISYGKMVEIINSKAIPPEELTVRALCDRLFELANAFAVLKEGEVAVKLHAIYNSIEK